MACRSTSLFDVRCSGGRRLKEVALVRSTPSTLHAQTCSIARPRCDSHRLRRIACQAKKSADAEKPDPGLALKAVWVGAESFGNLLGLAKKKKQGTREQPAVLQMTREQAVNAIRDDYAKEYFCSGVGDMSAYDENCLFADDFSSFKGVQRFKKNVSNLGGMMEDIQLDLLDFKEEGDQIVTRWRFSSLLQLPWRPRLAAAGGTTHVFDKETGKVIEHIERWDVEPWPVVKQLLRPARRNPEGRWETFMLALSDGDIKRLWLTTSNLALQGSLPIIAVSLATKAATGHGLPGIYLGSVEGLAFLLALAAIPTEVYKVLGKK